jgi:hypothetical protein
LFSHPGRTSSHAAVGWRRLASTTEVKRKSQQLAATLDLTMVIDHSIILI